MHRNQISVNYEVPEDNLHMKTKYLIMGLGKRFEWGKAFHQHDFGCVLPLLSVGVWWPKARYLHLTFIV
jgi:hypothetical protein